jgi:hypothetical protein
MILFAGMSSAYHARAVARMSEYSLKPGFVASETAARRAPTIPPPMLATRIKAEAARARRTARARDEAGFAFR